MDSRPDARNASQAVSLRDSKPADFDRLWSLDQKCFPPGIAYDRRTLRWYMRQAQAFTIVAEMTATDIPEKSRELPGFILVNVLDGDKKDDGTTANIVTIDVDEPYRRAGLGSRLLEAAEVRARSIGCAIMDLEVDVNNAVAIAFYIRHGFVIIGRIEKYYNETTDAHVMKKSLA